VYAAERMLRDTGEKLGASDRQAVESAMQDLKTAVSGTDTGAITRAMDQLMAAQHKAAEALYKQASSARAESTGGGPKGDGAAGQAGGSKDDVIDAEVVDDKQ
jgi:molecular chaperone DnaK